MKVTISSDDSEDVNLTEIGIINSNEKTIKELARIPKDQDDDDKEDELGDIFFDKHFGKQREVREKLISLQESLKKKKGDAKSHGRRFGIVYRHNGFDEGHRHHKDDAAEEEEEEAGDEFIKATVDEAPTTPPTPKMRVPEITLDNVNNIPADVDVKEMIALAHHKSYHHEDGAKKVIKSTTAAPTVGVEGGTQTPHHDIHVPHDTAHYGNLRFLDFAPEHKDISIPPKDLKDPKDNATPKSPKVPFDAALPETSGPSGAFSNNPYFLSIPNNPVKIQSIQIKETNIGERNNNENIFNEVRKAFASAVPSSDFKEPHQEGIASTILNTN